jgi:hypothetical protein
MKKKLAVVLFGLSYCEKYIHWTNDIYIINHDLSFKNYNEYIFDYFRDNQFEIDVFISSNSSIYSEKLINLYNPKKYLFCDDKKISSSVNDRNIKFCNALNLCIEYADENSIAYDNILMTRFDINFMIKFDKVKIDYNAMNIVSILEKNDFIDDNFYLFPFCKSHAFLDYCLKRIFIYKNIKAFHYEIKNNLIKIFGNINYLKNEHKFVKDLSFYKIVREKKIRGLIINGNELNDIIYYNLESNSSIMISNNRILFEKLNKNICPYAWFGYIIENKGEYKIKFKILSNKKINKKSNNGIKLHSPVKIYNDFLDNVEPGIWEKIEVIVNVENNNDTLLFIFDDFDDSVNIIFENIEIEDITYKNVIIGLFGFCRNYPPEYKINIKKIKTYIHTPSLKYEDKSEVISEKEINDVYGAKTIIDIYDYNKDMYINKIKKISISKFNDFYQQAYRISSFFHNIKCTIDMIFSDNKIIAENEIIILCRIDIGINKLDIPLIKHLLFVKKYDIIVNSFYKDTGLKIDGCDDKYFVFTKKSIDVFYNLYDDYENYLNSYYHDNNKINLINTRPEDIFLFHFKKYGKNIINSNVIDYSFDHVCSKFCGHNKENAEE